jgi:TfoX/Sxy family transcriptional regulator of competence genes
MSYDEKLTDRVREALVDIPNVEEKKMFRGVCFMVDDKMCICISGDELMCRVSPEIYEGAVEKPGCRTMLKNGKPIKGFIFVSQSELKTKAEFDYWVNHCLGFNKFAKSSKTKGK